MIDGGSLSQEREHLSLRRSLPLVVIIILCGFGCFAATAYYLYYLIIVDPASEVEPHDVISSTRFRTLWTDDDIFLPSRQGTEYNLREPLLLVQNDCVVVVDIEASFVASLSKPSVLKCLNLATGEIKWQVEDVGVHAATHNSRFIFVATGRSLLKEDCASRECDVLTVEAYDIDTGQLAWSESYQGLQVVDQIVADESIVGIRGGGGHGAYTTALSIDVETGERLSYVEIPEASGPDYQALLALAESRGDVVSNLEVEDGIIYFMTADATLWALEEESGRLAGRVDLAPDLFLLVSNIYYIVAKDGIVAVYLDDSKQLFTFQRIGEGDGGRDLRD